MCNFISCLASCCHERDARASGGPTKKPQPEAVTFKNNSVVAPYKSNLIPCAKGNSSE